MTVADDDWPPQAIPVGEYEFEQAVDTIRRQEDWASLFTRAALADELAVFFGRGWNVESLRRALVHRPDSSRYGVPPVSSQDVVDRWASWSYPPIGGYELGTALAAQFNRDNERTIRDDWAAKAIPANPVQAFRAARWVRFMYGWSTYATLKSLAVLLLPWFKAGWCPAAISWAAEHRPDGSTYAGPVKSLTELDTRLGEWKKARKEASPPIVGGSWEEIVKVRRGRIAVERVNEDSVARFEQQQRLGNERWHYKRSLAGARESDAAIDVLMRQLHPTMPRLYGIDSPPESTVDDDLCRCERYYRLPGQPACAACITNYRRVRSTRRHGGGV